MGVELAIKTMGFHVQPKYADKLLISARSSNSIAIPFIAVSASIVVSSCCSIGHILLLFCSGLLSTFLVYEHLNVILIICVLQAASLHENVKEIYCISV